MQGSSYAPLQFLRSPWNRDVYTAIDNQVDGRTTLVLYLGAASSLPSELQKYNVGCILIHKDEKQIYLNTGNDTTPTWESFGPGTNTLPTPFVSGQYLTNDGVDAFWSLIDLATGVDGLLDSDHIDLSDLANNSDFIDYLIGNSYFTSSLANDSNFLTNLITNLNSAGTLAVVTDGVTITGDGTSGNPLTATGGSDNYTVKATTADTTPSYLDDKISIVSTDGTVSITKTINNPAANEDIEYNLSVSGLSSQPFSGIIQYNIFDTVTPSDNTILELSDGTLFTYLWSTTNKYYISYDKTKVYKLESVATGGSNFTLTLKEYTGNGSGSIGTLTTTYTRSSSTTIGGGVSFGINHNAFCVEGGKLFAPVTETGVTEYYTEYTLSGASIASPVLTNMQYPSTATEQISYRYWVYDGTYHYIQNLGGAGAIVKRSYSSPNFTTVATANASRLLSTQAYQIGTPELLITNFFKISGGKIGNFCSPGTASNTYPGIIYAEINTI